VEADHEDARRAGVELEGGILLTEQADQFIVDDFDHLLARLDRLDDLIAEGLSLDPFNEIAGHTELDIGVQQGEADVAQGITHVRLGDFSEPAEIAEDVLELAAQGIEHGGENRQVWRRQKKENGRIR
jgi:hypothetical protein